MFASVSWVMSTGLSVLTAYDMATRKVPSACARGPPPPLPPRVHALVRIAAQASSVRRRHVDMGGARSTPPPRGPGRRAGTGYLAAGAAFSAASSAVPRGLPSPVHASHPGPAAKAPFEPEVTSANASGCA